jgi:hypothetical protein
MVHTGEGGLRDTGWSKVRILKAMVAILKVIRDLTGSQCRLKRTGVMCSEHLVPVMKRASVHRLMQLTFVENETG